MRGTNTNWRLLTLLALALASLAAISTARGACVDPRAPTPKVSGAEIAPCQCGEDERDWCLCDDDCYGTCKDPDRDSVAFEPNQRLWTAMHLADAAKARSALADKANPNTCSLDRRVTPLLAATIENEMQLVKLLLDAGADPNGLTCKGIAPLFIAVGHNNLELMKLLLSFGANVEAGRHEMTPLQAAAMSGDVDMVDVLLQHKVSPNVVCEGWSALTLASNPTEVTAGHVAVVDLLLRAGADPNLAPRDSDVGHGCNALSKPWANGASCRLVPPW
jgi:ankyrin repeat protein